MEVLLISIVGWIITIAVALYSAKSGAKDTTIKIKAIEDNTQRQISALDESTRKQVESIKHLAKIQIKTTQLQINKELHEVMIREKQVLKKRWDVVEREYGWNGQTIEIGAAGDFYRNREEKEKNLEYDGELYAKLRTDLMNCQKQLNDISKQLDEV